MKVARLSDLWSGELTGVVAGGTKLLLIRLGDRVYAYEDRCSHLGLKLSEGRLDGSVLTCRGHEWQYDVTTGCGINPASACLRAFPVSIVNGEVWVDAV